MISDSLGALNVISGRIGEGGQIASKKRKIGKMPSQAMYYYRPYNDGIVDLIRIPVFWTE